MKLPEDKASEWLSKTMQGKKETKRTTFKLSNKSTQALDWMIESLGYTAKEAFDLVTTENDFFDAVVKSTKTRDSNPKNQKRKTYVISKQALSLLNKTSAKADVSRDLLVEQLILSYKALMQKFLEKEKQNEEKALKIISNFWSEAEKVQKKLKDLLTDENPVLFRFGMITVVIENLYSAIDSKLSNGVPIDPDDMSQQK